MAICTELVVTFTLNADGTITVTSDDAPNFAFTSGADGAESALNVVRGLLKSLLGAEELEAA